MYRQKACGVRFREGELALLRCEREFGAPPPLAGDTGTTKARTARATHNRPTGTQEER